MSKLYNVGALQLTAGTPWESLANIGILLTTSSYTPDQDHNDVADVTNELSGGGYGRLSALGSRTRTQNDTDNRIEFDAADIVFPSLAAAAGTPGYCVIYDSTNGTDATRTLIGWLTLPGTIPDGSDYTISWAAAGLWVISTS